MGRLFAKLRELGIEDDTIVFFTSDNGPHREGGNNPDFFRSSGPLRGIKRDLYEGGIRVPMVVRWPGRVPAGAVSDQPWAFWDFLPTAAELAGANAPADIDGVSMAPAILRGERIERPYLYWEFFEGGFNQAVRTGDWKAVRKNQGDIELYDLASDLGETNNLAAERPEIVRRIEAILRAARTPSREWPVAGESRDREPG
jgi:arylsulfatase A-like enzyme